MVIPGWEQKGMGEPEPHSYTVLRVLPTEPCLGTLGEKFCVRRADVNPGGVTKVLGPQSRQKRQALPESLLEDSG